MLHFLTSLEKALLTSTLTNLLHQILDPLGAFCLQSGGHGLAAHCPMIKPLIVKHCKVIKTSAHFKGAPFRKSPKCFLSFIPSYPLITGKVRVIVMNILAAVSASPYHSILSLYVVHCSSLKPPASGWMVSSQLFTCGMAIFVGLTLLLAVALRQAGTFAAVLAPGQTSL